MIITSSHLFIANDFATRAVAAELRSRSVFPGAPQVRKAHTAECLHSPGKDCADFRPGASSSAGPRSLGADDVSA